MKNIIILFITFFFIACNDGETQDTNSKVESVLVENQSETNIIDNSINEKIVTQENKDNQNVDSDTLRTIRFQDFSITLSGIYFWDPKNTLDIIQEDTVLIQIEPGIPTDGIMAKFISSEFDSINASHQFETSVTIMDEGPHCDLINWKHHNSEWKKISKANDSTFIFQCYDKIEWEIFPEVDNTELREAVKLHCGESWANLVKEISSPNEYPAGVSLSKYYIKLTGSTKNNSEPFEKVIIIEVPMGC